MADNTFILIDDFARAQQLADALRPDDLQSTLHPLRRHLHISSHTHGAQVGSASVKIYDKVGRVLRIETTTNDVSFFKHHRKVEHNNGTETQKLAQLKKSICSLFDLREILLGCNRRYLDFFSSLDDHSDGQRALQKLTEPKTVQKTTWRGFNFFAATDLALLHAVLDPKFNIHGLRRADLKPYLPKLSDSSLSRQNKTLAHIWPDQTCAWYLSILPDQTGQSCNGSLCSCN